MQSDARDALLMKVQAEFQHFRTLRHKNLVAYLGANISNDTLDIMQEYVPFMTLQTYVKNNPMLRNEDNIAEFTQDILQGVEFLHQKGLTHGNIKAANVFVRGDECC